MNAITMAEIQIRGSPGVPPGGTPGPAETAAVRPVSRPNREPEAQPGPDAAPEPRAVEQAAAGVNAFLKSSGSHVQFAYHQEAKRMMVEVIDDRTQEVIRTIPTRELLDLAAKIGEMVGVLLDKKG